MYEEFKFTLVKSRNQTENLTLNLLMLYELELRTLHNNKKNELK